MNGSRLVTASALAAIAIACQPAQAAGEDPLRFDGSWSVTLNCPAHHDGDDARGYTHDFPAEIKGAALRGTHGSEGQPSWHLLTGDIAPDGTALLTLDGIVSNPAYAINNAHRGKPYSYRVDARFEPSSGAGQRLGKRRCSFSFKRR